MNRRSFIKALSGVLGLGLAVKPLVKAIYNEQKAIGPDKAVAENIKYVGSGYQAALDELAFAKDNQVLQYDEKTRQWVPVDAEKVYKISIRPRRRVYT